MAEFVWLRIPQNDPSGGEDHPLSGFLQMAEDAGHAVMPVAAGFDTGSIPKNEIERQIEEADAYIASSIDVAQSRYLVQLVLDQVVRRGKRLVVMNPHVAMGAFLGEFGIEQKHHLIVDTMSWTVFQLRRLDPNSIWSSPLLAGVDTLTIGAPVLLRPGARAMRFLPLCPLSEGGHLVQRKQDPLSTAPAIVTNLVFKWWEAPGAEFRIDIPEYGVDLDREDFDAFGWAALWPVDDDLGERVLALAAYVVTNSYLTENRRFATNLIDWLAEGARANYRDYAEHAISRIETSLLELLEIGLGRKSGAWWTSVPDSIREACEKACKNNRCEGDSPWHELFFTQEIQILQANLAHFEGMPGLSWHPEMKRRLWAANEIRKRADHVPKLKQQPIRPDEVRELRATAAMIEQTLRSIRGLAA
jgi:hypothetical protein